MALKKNELEAVKQVGTKKMSWYMVKLYNKLCHKCKVRTILVTKRGKRVSLKDYCETCQVKAGKILKKLEVNK